MARRVGFIDIAGAAVNNIYRQMAVDFGAPLRALRLRTPIAPIFSPMPETLPLGNSTEGLKLLDGRFTLGSQTLDVGAHGDPWLTPAPSETFAFRLHSFEWLEHLNALRFDKAVLKANQKIDERSRRQAHHLVDRWIQVFGSWNSYAWGNEVLANRLFAWLTSGDIVFNGGDTPQGAARRASTLKQLKRLQQTYRRVPAGTAKLKVAACLVLGGICMETDTETFLARGLDWLDDEIDIQILADGGHISRSPQQIALSLEILLCVDRALEAKGMQGSKEVRRAIDRLTPMVFFLSDADGNLFSFNGGGSGDKKRTKILLDQVKIRPKQFGYAPHTKFQRLGNNGTTLMIDVGTSPPPRYDLDAHLAPLAFELATEAGPLIVNCGWSASQPQHWREHMRHTAAHSTLVLGGQDAGNFLKNGIGKKALGPCISEASGPVHAMRKEQNEGTWLDTSHEAYVKQFGLIHGRKLYMDVLGSDIRGEDTLMLPLGGAPITREQIGFEIRFHLHPSVKATLAQDQKSALLIQPGGNGWRFRTDAGPLHLEKSVYLASGKKPVSTEQVVIYGNAYGDGDGQARSNKVRWSFKRLDGLNTSKSK